MKEPVQHGAGVVLLAGDRVGGLHLSQDLRLSDDERIQTGGDAEQVPRRVGTAVDVEMCLHIGRRHAVVLGKKARHLLDRVVVIRGGVDLGPVARRQDGHFANGVARCQARQGGLEAVAGEVDPFAQLDRRGLVIHADGEEAHAQKLWLLVRKYPTGMKLRSTIAKPAVDSSAARRPFQPIARRA